ncbi:MAG: type II toxin-antitoxin system VapC family toxin [Verrucomicrobiota bacterium]
MIFADTSLLCALYREQDNSPDADRLMRRINEPIHVSSFVLFEFRQSTRLQAFRFTKDRTQGFSKLESRRMLNTLEANITAGRIVVSPVEWQEVHSIAEKISAQHTMTGGHRTLDVLHVATALHLKAREFLTFDENQAELAKAAGLKMKP